MNIFNEMQAKDHEQVVFCSDKESGLKAIIAIHDTTLGPALGGCRMWPYKSEEEALRDVLRLSRGMTYKSAVAGLNLGGGKAVIIGDYKTMKSEALFRAFGRFVQSLGGRYITAEDVGTSVHDMEWARKETDYVTGILQAFGGSGDPSPVTAFGVYKGICAALNWMGMGGEHHLDGKTIAIQGVGAVGTHLVKQLVKSKAKVIISDIDKDNIKRCCSLCPEVKVVDPEEILFVECDVLSPSALGGVINDDTIDKLQCKIVAGSANNVLADEDRHCSALEKRDILYVPDFVINSGGLINVANEIDGYNRRLAYRQAADIYNIVTVVLDIAKNEKITTNIAAKILAKRRIKDVGRLHKTYVGVPLQKRGRGII